MNVCYDLSLLNAELVRADLQPLTIDGPVLDPLVLDRAVDRYRRGSRKLTDLCRHYHVPHSAAAPGEDVTAAAGAHDAKADVLAALRVLWRIANAYPQLAAMELADVHERQVKAHEEWATHLQHYLRESGKEPDAVVDTAWPIRRAVVPA
jgi:DNA polymerase-3 subunit epsilon